MTTILYIRSLAHASGTSLARRQNQTVVACLSRDTFVSENGSDDLLYEAESARLLDALKCLPETRRSQVEVVDVGRFTGWVKAWAAGVRNIPALRQDDRLYEGREAAEKALVGGAD